MIKTRTEVRNPVAVSLAHLRKLALGMALAAVLSSLACNHAAGPPAPLPVEQIPGEIKKAFAQARPEVQSLITELDGALETHDYAAAYQRVQLICYLPDATEKQHLVSSRAMLTLTALLQAARAQGDSNAAAVLNFQQRTR